MIPDTAAFIPEDGESRDDIADRYYEMLRLARRVDTVMAARLETAGKDMFAAKSNLARDLAQMVGPGSERSLLGAIETLAESGLSDDAFLSLARKARAMATLRDTAATYGPSIVQQQALDDKSEKLSKQKESLRALQKRVGELEARLEPITSHNQGLTYSSQISAANRKEIESYSSFFSDGNKWQSASELVKQYRKRHSTQMEIVSCFDDMAELEKGKGEMSTLKAQIRTLDEDVKKRQIAWFDTKEALQMLGTENIEGGMARAFDQFRARLQEKLDNPRFVRLLAGAIGTEKAGAVVLSSVRAAMCKKIVDNLTLWQSRVNEGTKLLEGPIGSIARAAGTQRTLDGIEHDVTMQSLMAGYLCQSAAMALDALKTFRPDHVEGPVSLMRECEMHMIVSGVDAAYVHEIFGLDQTLAAVFNVNAVRPVPDFRRILGAATAVEREDMHYARFLSDSAGNEELAAAGFSAGRMDVVSFEKFLGRYFPTGTTLSGIREALLAEEKSIESVRDKRREMGIPPDGAKPPGIDKA